MPQQHNNPVTFDSFLNKVKMLENDRFKGYNPQTKTWTPFVERGGANPVPTLAWGTTRGISPNQTYTRQQADQFLRRDMMDVRNRYLQDPRFKGWAKAPSRIQNIMMDGTYQTGQLYPKFWNAYQTGNRPSMRQELKSYLNKAKGIPDARRNAERLRWLQQQLDSVDRGHPFTSLKKNLGQKLASSCLMTRQKVKDFKPTEAQAHAGNYPKLHMNMHGFRISIENPKDSYRCGVGPDGKEWKTKMTCDYGYLRGTEAIDGDQVDIFLGPKAKSAEYVHIVDQVKPGTKMFDEHKCMIGWDSITEAKKAYLSNYEKGWTGLGAITTVPMEEFKKWVRSHEAKKPYCKNMIKLSNNIAKDLLEKKSFWSLNKKEPEDRIGFPAWELPADTKYDTKDFPRYQEEFIKRIVEAGYKQMLNEGNGDYWLNKSPERNIQSGWKVWQHEDNGRISPQEKAYSGSMSPEELREHLEWLYSNTKNPIVT